MRCVGLAFALAGLLLGTASLAADGPPATVADLGWMTGSWAGATARGTLEETWTAPRSGTISAVVRSMQGESTGMVELIVIAEEAGSLVLRLQQWSSGFEPRMEKPQEMRLVESAPNRVGFEAVGEGGIRRIAYSRPAPDTFVVAGETSQGATFEVELKAQAAEPAENR